MNWSFSYRNGRSRVGANSFVKSWPAVPKMGWGTENSFIDHSSVNYDDNPPYMLSGDNDRIFAIPQGRFYDATACTQALPNQDFPQIMESSVPSHASKSDSDSENGSTVTSEQVYASIFSLAAVGFPSSIMAILALQLILHLEFYNRSLTMENSSGLTITTTYGVLFDVALSLSSVTLTFSVTAMFVSFLQLFLCLKAVKLAPDSKLRTMKFLRQGMCLRFVAFVGFFLSIPIFLLAVMISVHVLEMYGSNVTGAAFTVIGGIGLLICSATVAHTLYSWFIGHLCLTVSTKEKKQNKKDKIKLSTLV